MHHYSRWQMHRRKVKEKDGRFLVARTEQNRMYGAKGKRTCFIFFQFVTVITCAPLLAA